MRFSNGITGRSRHIFLDLENTLIKSWDDPFTFNHDEQFRNRLDRVSFWCKCHLFTWAINKESELCRFTDQILPKIESEFNIKIDQIILKDECITVTKSVRKIQVLDEFDLSQLIGKGDAFFDFCKFHKIRDAQLFDDTVDDLSLTHESGITVTTNVKFKKG